jgi:hypothetical protein
MTSDPQPGAARRAEPAPASQPATDEDIPALQQMLDNPFLLLFLGVAIPTVIYLVWGIMEIATIPISPLGR